MSNKKEDFDDLKKICERIISISNENFGGALMASQYLMLGDNIKDFINNPIVASSGIIPKLNQDEKKNI
jgi:hypothetical protein